jgi:uncharacterized protein YecE (DUF72 family)
MLAYYAERFDCAEINNSFYNLPDKRTFREWVETVPSSFIFSVKASRYITHMKKLKDPGGPVKKFFNNVDTLGHHLGPVLFQLPPRWKFNAGRLNEFLGSLPEGKRYTFEFRDHSWHNRETYDMLEQSGSAFCIYHLDGFLSPKEVTADFVYIRLHGPEGSYEGRYGPSELSGWAGAINAWLSGGLDVYCFFDNDQNAYAPQDALRLKQMFDR